MFYRFLIITLFILVLTAEKIQANQAIADPSIGSAPLEKKETKVQEIQVPSNNKPLAVKGPTLSPAPIPITQTAQSKPQQEKNELPKNEMSQQKVEKDQSPKLNTLSSQKTENQNIAQQKLSSNSQQVTQKFENSKEKAPSAEATQKIQQKPNGLIKNQRQAEKKQQQVVKTEEKKVEKDKQVKTGLKSSGQKLKAEPAKQIDNIEVSSKVEVVPVATTIEPKKQWLINHPKLPQTVEIEKTKATSIQVVKGKDKVVVKSQTSEEPVSPRNDKIPVAQTTITPSPQNKPSKRTQVPKQEELMIPSNNKPLPVTFPTSEAKPTSTSQQIKGKLKEEKAESAKDEGSQQKMEINESSKLSVPTTKKIDMLSASQPKPVQNSQKVPEAQDKIKEKVLTAEVGEKTQQKPKGLKEHSRQTEKKKQQVSETEDENAVKSKQDQKVVKQHIQKAKTEPTKLIEKVEVAAKIQVVPVTKPSEPKHQRTAEQTKPPQSFETERIKQTSIQNAEKKNNVVTKSQASTTRVNSQTNDIPKSQTSITPSPESKPPKRAQVQLSNKTNAKSQTLETAPIPFAQPTKLIIQQSKKEISKNELSLEKIEKDKDSKLNAVTTTNTEKQQAGKQKQTQNSQKAAQSKDINQDKTLPKESEQKNLQKPKGLVEQTEKEQQQVSETEEEAVDQKKQDKIQLKSQEQESKSKAEAVENVETTTKVEAIPAQTPSEPKSQKSSEQPQQAKTIDIQQPQEKQAQNEENKEDIEVSRHQVERQQINEAEQPSDKAIILRADPQKNLNLRTQQKDLHVKLNAAEQRVSHHKQQRPQQNQAENAIVDSDPQLPKQQIMDSQTIIVLIILTFIISIPVVREIRSKGGETLIKRRQAAAPAAVTKTISQSRIDEDYSEIDNGTGLEIGDRLDEEQA